MPDVFFQKKRKRSGSSGSGEAGPSSSASKSSRNGGPSRGKPGASSTKSAAGRSKRGRNSSSKGGPTAGSGSEDEDGGADNADEMDLAHRYDDELLSEDEEVEETPAEARVRLAKMYLEGLKGDVDENDVDAAAIDADNIAARLQRDVSQRSTHLHVFVSSLLSQPSSSSVVGVRGHRSSVTSAVVTPDAKHLITAGKEGSIILWRLSDGRMQCVVPKSGEAKLQQRSGGAAKSSTSGAGRRRRRAKLAALHAAGKMGGGRVGPSNGFVAEGEGEGEHVRCHRLQLGVKQGHSDEIWTLAVSSDGKFLATAGKDKRIGVWELGKGKKAVSSEGSGGVEGTTGADGSSTAADVLSASKSSSKNAGSSSFSPIRWLKALGGHKDGITSLGFRTGSADLFSASLDRTLKLFDVSQLSYVESFFGHQEGAQHLDVLRGEVLVSVGGRDRTARWWKVREESQLVFRGGAKSKIREVLEGGMDAQEEREAGEANLTQEVEGSLEVTAMVDEHHFLTGGDTGTISLWSLAKKKPIFTFPSAHGHEERYDAELRKTVQLPRWITSLACLAYGDIFASGSWDGQIRVWRLDARLRSFEALFTVPAAGFVNSLQILQPSRPVVKSARRKGWEGVVRLDKWKRVGGLGVSSGRGGEEESDQDDSEDDSDEESSDDDDFESAESSPAPAASTSPDVVGSANGKTPTSSGGAGGGAAEGAKETEPILVAALGQEPRLGRWKRIPQARNGAIVVPLRFK